MQNEDLMKFNFEGHEGFEVTVCEMSRVEISKKLLCQEFQELVSC